ncbi:MAG: aminomethyl transferase family protein [Actinomycetales bacterium]|nr:aminomethyl transferase family protein [Actinomycetales bacterium]
MASRRTPFHLRHEQAGAVFYRKGDWIRPLRYGDPVEEHLRCRSAGGVFDVHSMGKVVVRGPGAVDLLDLALAADVRGLEVGDARYGCLCGEDGGILDDLIVYRTDEARYYLITNTFSRERVLGILDGLAGPATTVEDVTSAIAYVAVQGPRSRRLLADLGVSTRRGEEEIPYFGCTTTTWDGVPLLLARTGYTGELGYELNVPAEYALDVWDSVCRAGEPHGVTPCGGEALMSLRLEKGYRSYGSDIDPSVSPVEAGLSWTVAWHKPAFTGREALLAAREHGPTRRAVYLLGLDGSDFGPQAVLGDADGRPVGVVTSGLYGPSVEAHVGLGYLDSSVRVTPDTVLTLADGGRVRPATRPFFDPTGERLRA